MNLPVSPISTKDKISLSPQDLTTYFAIGFKYWLVLILLRCGVAADGLSVVFEDNKT